MTPSQLRYLQGINQQLGGPLRSAMPDKMSAYLLDCVFSISNRLVIGDELGAKLRAALKKALAEQHTALKSLLGASADGKALLAEVDEMVIAPEADERIDSIAARVAALLMHEASPDALHVAGLLIEADAHNWRALQTESDRKRTEAAERIEREVDAMTAEEQGRFVDLLRRECDESPQLKIAKVFTVPGGYSKQTIIVTLENNRTLPNQIVVRRDRAESPVGSSVVDELALLQTVFDAGMRVPKPWLLDRGTVMSTPIIVVSKISGHNIGDVYTVHEKDERYALDLADQLAILHNIPLANVRADMPGRTISNIDFMRNELEEFLGHWRQTGERSITMDAGGQWLLKHVDCAETQQCVIHRDTRFHNIICDNGELKALLDWELAMIGHPSRDLGWLYHQVVQMMDWRKFLARYRASGGPHCSDESLTFYAMWSDWYCAVQMYRARAGFMSGQAPFAYAYAGEEMRHQNVNSVAKLLHQIMTNGTL